MKLWLDRDEMSPSMDEFACNSIRKKEISSLYTVIRNKINVRTNFASHCSRVLNTVQLHEQRKRLIQGLNEAFLRHIDLAWLEMAREFGTNYLPVLPRTFTTFYFDRSSNSTRGKNAPMAINGYVTRRSERHARSEY